MGSSRVVTGANRGSRDIFYKWPTGKLRQRQKKQTDSAGALIPRAKVIERANKSRSQPLRKAATLVNTPRTSATPSRVSRQVTAQARAGIAADGMNQLSFPVYATKCEKSPQETLGCPRLPHRPKRSATAERKEMPRATRKNTEL